jgi:hypothetical protein
VCGCVASVCRVSSYTGLCVIGSPEKETANQISFTFNWPIICNNLLRSVLFLFLTVERSEPHSSTALASDVLLVNYKSAASYVVINF